MPTAGDVILVRKGASALHVLQGLKVRLLRPTHTNMQRNKHVDGRRKASGAPVRPDMRKAPQECVPTEIGFKVIEWPQAYCARRAPQNSSKWQRATRSLLDSTYHRSLSYPSLRVIVILAHLHCRQPRGVIKVDLHMTHVGHVRGHEGAHHRWGARTRPHAVTFPPSRDEHHCRARALGRPPRVRTVLKPGLRRGWRQIEDVGNSTIAGAEVVVGGVAVDDNLFNCFFFADLSRENRCMQPTEAFTDVLIL